MTEKLNKETILEKFCKRHGPQKSVSFYKALVKLYLTNKDMVLELVNTIPQWGYYKDYFMIQLYCHNYEEKEDDEDDEKKTVRELSLYIYELLIETLEDDYANFKKGLGKNEISMLAKWIPRQNKSFDKKYGFVNEICKLMYPNDSSLAAKIKYRKMISTLNKHLGTTEIYLCSKEYDKIDFDNMPSNCYYRNMKTFMNNDITKSKMRTHLYSKYVKFDFKEFMDKIIFKKNSDFEKGILIEVWNINRLDYKDQLDTLLGINMNNVDVLIDMSKSMYDNKLISISIGIALLVLSYGNKVIINAHKPYLIDRKERQSLFDLVELISNECAYFNTMNIEKTIPLIKKKNLLVVSDKVCDKIIKDDKIKVTYWQLLINNLELESEEWNDNFMIYKGNFYNTFNIKQEMTNYNKKIISNIIDTKTPSKYVKIIPYLITAFSLTSAYFIFLY